MAKKRRKDQAFQHKRLAQTITPSKVFSDPRIGLSSFGLHREIGVKPKIHAQIRADDTWVSGLTSVNLPMFGGGSLFSVTPVLESKRKSIFVHTSTTDWHGTPTCPLSYVLLAPMDLTASDQLWTKSTMDRHDFLDHRVADIIGWVSSISVGPGDDTQPVVVTYNDSLEDENLCISKIGPDADHGWSSSKLGGPETTLWTSEIDPSGQFVAIGGSDQLCTIALETARFANRDLQAAECRSLTWFSRSVVAASMRKSVMLWDTRVSERSERFKHSDTITGVENVPNSAGNQLVVASNRKLTLYDVRMAGRSAMEGNDGILSLPTYHEGLKAVYDVNDRGLVACSVKRGTAHSIEVSSLRTGMVIKMLELDEVSRQRLPTQVAWREDERGAEFLQACAGSSLHKWSWHTYLSEG